MYHKLFQYINRRPELYEPSTSKFWDNEHISKGMLEAHLNPDWEAATRKLDFVHKSASWIAEIADPLQRPKLLDLGCGPGIYAELFTEKGFQVTGLDLSPRSIQYAEESSLQKHLDIEYRCGNYLELNYEGKFDVVTLIYCDFGVLNPEDRQLLLSSIHKALKPDGLFIVDAWTPKYYESTPETTSWSYEDGGFWTEKPHLCLEAFYRYEDCNTFVDQCVIVEEGSTQCYNIWNHAFTSKELRSALTTAGFSKVDFYGNVAGKPYSEEGMELCAVAQKNTKPTNSK